MNTPYAAAEAARTKPVRLPKAHRRPTSGGRLRHALAVTAVVGLTALLLPPALAAGAYVLFRASDVVAPGVTVAGVPIGGQRVAEGSAMLDRIWNHEAMLTVVDASDPTRTWQAQPADFGLRLDAEASAARVLHVGRDRNWVEAFTSLVRTLRFGEEVAPVVTFDEAAAAAGLETWGRRASIEPVEALLEIQGGQVVAAAGRAGKSLDLEASLGLLRADPEDALLTYRLIPLIMAPVSPQITEVAPAAAEVERLLSSQPTLRAYDPVTGEDFHWSPTQQEIFSWLRIERGISAFQIEVDASRLQQYVLDLNDNLGPERGFDVERAAEVLAEGLQGAHPEPLVIRYQPRSYVVGPRDTWVSVASQVGIPYWKIVEANPQAAARGLTPGEAITIPPHDAMLGLPVVVDKRIVISIGEQHLWAYQDGELVDDFVVSTGIASSPTLPGIFQVQSHYPNAYASIWDLWMPNFMGIYEAAPGFWNGIHGLPLLSSGVRLWANVLGRPASFGCIILDLPSAEWLYNWAEEGVVVEIRR
ncbi:MAG: L,D-transpeptidase family protein [Chloroflexota bacterium]